MGKNLEKFLLLLWKNWKLQYRKPIQTLTEIGAPIIFLCLLVIIRSLVNPTPMPTREFPRFLPIPLHFLKNITALLDDNSTSPLKKLMIVYSPSPNTVLDRSMGYAKFFFKDIKGLPSARLLEHHFATKEALHSLAGIQFDDDLYGKNEIPIDLKVSLRFPGELRSISGSMFNMSIVPEEGKATTGTSKKGSVIEKMNDLFGVRDWKTTLLYPIFQNPGPRMTENDYGADPDYYSEGFLALQVAVTYLLILGQLNVTFQHDLQLFGAMAQFPTIQMQRFPYPSWIEDRLLPALITFTALLVMLSFVYTCINTVKQVTAEKEQQLKEAMKIMGLPNWLHWTAWFLKTLSYLTITAVLIVIILRVTWYPNSKYSILSQADPIILFLFIMLYICATITLCFCVSVFFSKANTASAFAGLVWFVTFSPYMALQLNYDQLNLFAKLMTSLASNTAMSFGFQLFFMYEGNGEGIQWHNIWKPNTPDDSLTLGLIMLMLFIDALIYMCIALYVEAIHPGEYGFPQPWYFPVSYSYWSGKPKQLPVSEKVEETVTEKDFFDESLDQRPGIQIINLKKRFRKKQAVQNLSLNIYNDQITVLLGHNGAGKTTTISMLTGIIPPSAGTAVIQGFDIRTHMKDVRANLGLCPQHNLLFDELTVKEHLYFFSKLKGLDKTKIPNEIDKYVTLLELEPKLNKQSRTLSGGMKRKLCVGIALCGDSKVVLLDEPTAGMDPSARRALWDLLQAQKKGRCVLLTTHYMDEADVLGDRIAIMANGTLKCCGSSFFLKKKFGTGYHLILVKLINCNPDKVTDLLQNYVSELQIHRNVGAELVYLLSEEHVAVFGDMLADLEENLENLGVRSYGISLTTLEDVFIRVGADSETIQGEREFKPKEKPVKSANLTHLRLLSGLRLLGNQIIAMFMKKIINVYRTWFLQLIQISIPVVFLVIGIFVSRQIHKNKMGGDLPKLQLTLDSYENPVTLVQSEGDDEFSRFYYEILNGHKVVNVTSISSYMLNLTRYIPTTVRQYYLLGASFTSGPKQNVTAWFNNNPFHTPGLSLGLVLHALYKTMLGKEYSITYLNHPLPFTADTQVDRLLRGTSKGFQMGFNIGFGMAFVSSFYILFYVRERACKSKHLQFASGVKGYIFWIIAFICDLMTFTGTILGILFTLLCFQEDGFRDTDDLGRLFFLLFAFAVAVLPIMYFGSYIFSIPSTGFTRMTLIGVLTGATAFLVVQILSVPGLGLKYVADALHWAFLLMPHYSVSIAIRDTFTTYSTTQMCYQFVDNCLLHEADTTRDGCWYLACHNTFSEALSKYCCDRDQDFYKWNSPGVGRNLVYLLLLGTILFVLLILFEEKLFAKVIRKRGIATLPPQPEEDEDVTNEKQRIHNTAETQLLQDYSLVLKDLTKYYKKFLAVNGICLGVKQFECFGFLGVNGAGKTSTFKMITGDTSISHGEAWIQGFSIKNQMETVQKMIGYCPQFDALLDDLTVKETLIMFALLRGISLKSSIRLARDLAHDFDFSQHIHKKIKQLSGGNKRKVSTAISLIGDPPVLCLDEPTADLQLETLPKRSEIEENCSEPFL